MVGLLGLWVFAAVGAEVFPVDVRTVPVGATARAAGTQCVTPCSLSLPVGSHQVVVQLDGHPDQEATVDVFGHTVHEVRFEPVPTAEASQGRPAANSVLASPTPLTLADWEAMRDPKDVALEARARLKREEAMGRLRELLATAESPTRAEILLRLSDLLYQQAEQAGPEDPGTAWVQEAAAGYQSILDEYPTYARCDQAMYYLGMASYRLGQPEAAKEHFKVLAKRFPDSAYVPDAFLMLGELYASDNGFASLKGFLKATSQPDYAARPYAVYKLAWAYHLVGDPEKAIAEMKNVVELELPAAKEPLREASLQSLAEFFKAAGLLAEGQAYFRGRGRSDLL